MEVSELKILIIYSGRLQIIRHISLAYTYMPAQRLCYANNSSQDVKLLIKNNLILGYGFLHFLQQMLAKDFIYYFCFNKAEHISIYHVSKSLYICPVPP